MRLKKSKYEDNSILTTATRKGGCFAFAASKMYTHPMKLSKTGLCFILLYILFFGVFIFFFINCQNYYYERRFFIAVSEADKCEQMISVGLLPGLMPIYFMSQRILDSLAMVHSASYELASFFLEGWLRLLLALFINIGLFYSLGHTLEVAYLRFFSKKRR